MQIHSYYHPFSSSSSIPSSSSHFTFFPHHPHIKPLKPHHLFFFIAHKPRTKRIPLSSPSPSPSPFDNLSETQTQQPLDLLLNKPKPSPKPTSEPDPAPEIDDALAPFLKFFKSRNPDDESDFDSEAEDYPPHPNLPMPPNGQTIDEKSILGVNYYDPKPGDFAMGVVVSGNENKLDVNVGADMLGTMLTKEVLPMYEKEVDYLLCDLEGEGREELVGRKGGKMGIVKDEEAFGKERVEGRMVVEAGTVVFVEVLGRTLSGRPLLSARRMYRRVAWHRVRQVLYSLLS